MSNQRPAWAKLESISKTKYKQKARAGSHVVEHWLSKLQTMDSIPSTTNNSNKQTNTKTHKTKDTI
jgi:hypothetical protein